MSGGRDRDARERTGVAIDLEAALRVERHVAEWYRAQRIVPRVEAHDDPDVTWLVQPGAVWSNAGILVRFTEHTVAERLDTMLERYHAMRRGMGLWVTPASTPVDLERALRERRLHCRKRFPAMRRTLERAGPPATPPGLEIRLVEDASPFLRTPHPSIGRVTTPLRRYALDRLAALAEHRPRVAWPFVAWTKDEPVAASLLFLGEECAGLHDLTVRSSWRGRGIGRALLEHTCREAAALGAGEMVLLATGDGERLYRRAGFEEVARFAYWFRSIR